MSFFIQAHHLKSRFFDVQNIGFSNGRALGMATAIVPTIWTLGQNGGICPDFKWLGFQISDSICNPNHLQPNLFLTIPNPDLSRFQLPL